MAASKDSFVPWQTVIPLLLTLTGGLLLFRPLNSARPRQETPTTQAVGAQDVPARLWQDPFKDFPGDQKSTGSAERLTDLRNIIADQGAASAPTLVLPVMVPGGFEAEFVEYRRRTSVAVFSGLARCGFQPEDATHAGFIAVPLTVASADTHKSFAMRIPYQWLKPNQAKMPDALEGIPYGRVLILWLNENLMTETPCHRLNGILEGLLAGLADRGQPKQPNEGRWSLKRTGQPLDVKVIGPSVSSLLRAMAEEVGSGVVQTPLSNTTFYCATATAEAMAITYGLPLNRTVALDLHDLFPSNRAEGSGTPCRFVRTTHEDRDLCYAIINELKLRGLQPTKQRLQPNVAIISEWDTYYGAVLPRSYAALAGNESFAVQKAEDAARQANMFWYIRGIDGQAAGEPKPDKDTAKQEEQKGSSLWPTPSERPEGADQSDYLRRLAGRVAAYDTERRDAGEQLDAIGVLGTDPYDKLLILKAIRDRLPSVLCFTTSVDERFAMSGQQDAARNLVVASPYGFRASEYYQGGIPPFRDANQTANFVATLTAAGVLSDDTFSRPDVGQVYREDRPAGLGTPRIFEVGRSGFYNLTDDSDLPAGFKTKNSPTTMPVLQVRRSEVSAFSSLPGSSDKKKRTSRGFYLAIATIGMLATFIFGFGLRPRRFEPAKTFVTMMTFVALLVVLGLSMTVPSWIDGPQGLPFNFDGISVWPAEMLRAIVVVLCGYFIAKSFTDIRQNDARLERDFKLRSLDRWQPNDPKDPNVLPVPGDKKPEPKLRFNDWFVYGLRGRPNAAYPESALYHRHGSFTLHPFKVYAQNLWWEYQTRSYWACRLTRTVIATACYLCVAVLFVFWLGKPDVVIRGNLTRQVDFYMTLTSVVMSLFLYFYMLDACLLNIRLINRLSRATTHWPRGAFRAAWRTLGGPPQAVPSIEDMTEYMDIRFIARRTKIVGRSIYYPFIILGLMVLSRSTLFYDWHWPPSMVIIFGVQAALASLGALMLRNAAERARARALETLAERQILYVMQKRSAEEKSIDTLMKRVRDEQDGAFSILSQYPILGAILLPSSGFGIGAILNLIIQFTR